MNFYEAILILKMEDGRQHFQHVVLHCFQKGKTTSEMTKKICAMHGEGAVTDGTWQKWFVKFLGIIDTLAKKFFAVGCLTHWTVLSSTPDLYPLEANSRGEPACSKYSNQ